MSSSTGLVLLTATRRAPPLPTPASAQACSILPRTSPSASSTPVAWPPSPPPVPEAMDRPLCVARPPSGKTNPGATIFFPPRRPKLRRGPPDARAKAGSAVEAARKTRLVAMTRMQRS
eukprot:CAMPEP_0119000310 /NCGR_PEP_ID=MMETSP1173-20130426/64014_1 /TAXON_ID=1034831 /ORGANISM="Rhizochromulina marina cf, Strain CCMP1243" /LENGTH=117 /DNA_ID=CAMNT_0006951813 /DNA_START=926 /DNA_END=1279 /DNA_ORIENTATION=+